MKRRLMKILSGLVGVTCLVGTLPVSVLADGYTGTKVVIDLQNIRQEVDGFGVSQAAWSNAIYELEEPARSEVLDLLFTDNKIQTTREMDTYQNGTPVNTVREGIGLEIFRGNIFPEYTTQDEAGNIVYDFANARYDQAWVMKEAKKRGVDTFMASVWSPPGFMKSNGETTNGGKLKPEYYGEFAKLMAEFTVQFEELHGIEMDAISMANEPNSMTFLSWDSCEWYAPQIIDFAKNHLGPTFKEYGLEDIMLITDENSWWSDSTINKVFADPEAAAVFDIAASHNYRVPFGEKKPIVPFTRAKELGKKVWLTEVSTEGECDPGMGSALTYAKEIAQMFSKAEVNAYLYWTGIVPSAVDESLIYGNLNSSEYVLTKRFFAFGNYSKFIKPGYERIGVGQLDDKGIENAEVIPGVYITAYTDQSAGDLTMVMVNTNKDLVDMSLEVIGTEGSLSKLNTYVTDDNYDLEKVLPVYLDAGEFDLKLLPESVTTFTGQIMQSSNKAISTLEGVSEVKVDETVEVTLGVEQLQAMSYASDIYITYDPTVLEFIEAIGEEEIQPTIQKIDEKTLRVMASIQGGTDIGTELTTLCFKALPTSESTLTQIQVSTGDLGTIRLGETGKLPVEQSIKVIQVTPQKPPYESEDVNEDDKINVADLALVAYHYAKDSKDPNWNSFKKCDLNNDGKIDVADLSIVANKILE